MDNNLKKQLGCIMIITGTEIGAGILALPIITAKLGFILSSIVMLLAWCLMTYTALLIADISLSMPAGSSFAAIAKRTLGDSGAILAWISFLFLMYCISVAYISAASSAFHILLNNISRNTWSIIFVAILGGIVVIGTTAVDLINRILLTTKLICLVLVCLFLLKHIDTSNLMVKPVELNDTLKVAIPVIVTSFTSHIIVPTLTEYLNRNAKVLFQVIFYGSIIPLFLYLLWLIAVLGVLPLHGEISFMHSIFSYTNVELANVGDVLQALNQKITTSAATISLSIFTDISVITSYLGVSLALYHFNIDSYRLYRLPSIKLKIIIAILLTFMIPLFINVAYPNLFISAISYVGVSIGVSLLIMPSIIAYKLSKQKNHVFYYKISRIRYCWFIAFIVGAGIVIINFI